MVLSATYYLLPTNSHLENYWFQTRCGLTRHLGKYLVPQFLNQSQFIEELIDYYTKT